MVITKQALCQLAQKAIDTGTMTNYYGASWSLLMYNANKCYTLFDCARTGKRIGPKQIEWARHCLVMLSYPRISMAGVK